MRSADFKLLRKIKGDSINNCDFLKFIFPVSGGHCYCSSRTSINPATSLNIPCKSVNNNTHKTLSMQQQSHFTPDQLLQLYRAKWLLYIPSAVTLMQSALSIPTVACPVPATQCNSRTVKEAVCVVWRLFCSTESYTKESWPGFLNVGGWGIQKSLAVSWWKQQGGRNACSSYQRELKTAIREYIEN